ncbi:MAG TPA: metal ABC transporter ATP-binding protein [Nitrososphaeraceae archaeon]|jgi:zinc transport system ATP-binding protein|nr:metal ABC transporter ATP-binding protein [Nitrososphaeraceae archaeon]
MSLVSVQSISYNYNSEVVLKNVSLNVEEGDFLGIIGPNGAGKTTLFQCILGLLNTYSGRITVLNEDVKKNKKIFTKIGYIPQKKSIDQKFPLTVEELVSLSLTRKTSMNLVYEILKQVGLYNMKNKLIGHLSGGQQQRVLIAKALVNNPIILMLDEPTNELDQKSQDDFYFLLKELNEKNKITIMWTSHDLNAVNKYANKVSCINKKMFFHGDKEEFFSNEDHLKNYSESPMQIHMHTHDI